MSSTFGCMVCCPCETTPSLPIEPSGMVCERCYRKLEAENKRLSEALQRIADDILCGVKPDGQWLRKTALEDLGPNVCPTIGKNGVGGSVMTHAERLQILEEWRGAIGTADQSALDHEPTELDVYDIYHRYFD